MKCKSKKGAIGFGWIFAIVVVAILGTAGLASFFMQSVVQEPDKPDVGGIVGNYPQMTVGFNADPLATGEQDSDADVDIDVFEVKTSQGLKDLADEKIIDCTEAEPHIWDGSSTASVVDLKKSGCKMNSKKWAQDSSYTGGNSETKIDEATTGVKIKKADMSDEDADSNSTTTFQPGKQYIVTVTESASTDIEDVIAYGFLIEMPATIGLDSEQQKLTLYFKTEYYSDAVANSKITLGGSCAIGSDDANLDTNLDGAIPANFGVETAETGVNMDCEIEVEITKDGYCINPVNELPKTDSDKGSLQVRGFGQTYKNSTASYWVQLDQLTGSDKIKYSEAPTAVGNYSHYSIIADGVEILDTSETDADVAHNEKLHQDDLSFMKNVCGDNAKLIIPIEINDITQVNESVGESTLRTIDADALDEIIGEDDYLVNMTFTTPLSTTNAVTKELRG